MNAAVSTSIPPRACATGKREPARGPTAPRALTRLLAGLLLVTAAFTARADDAADREFTFAYGLMQRGETQLAADAFHQFLRQHTDDPRIGDAHYHLARLARIAGDLNTALNELNLVINPLYVTPQAVSLLRGQVQLERGRGPAAVAELEKIDPAQLPDAQWRAAWAYQLGLAYRLAGNNDAAEKRFTQATEAEGPYRAVALLELGKTRAALDRNPAAVEALLEGLHAGLKGESAAEARLLAADLDAKLGDYRQAADLYRQIVTQHQTSPRFAPALIGALRALDAASLDDKLIEQFNATQNLIAPADLAEAHHLVARADYRKSDPAAALPHIAEARRLMPPKSPMAPDLAYLEALCLYQTDPAAFEQRIGDLAAAVANPARSAELMFLRAQAAIKRGKPADALTQLAALINAPENAYTRRALLQHAALAEQSGRPDLAAADYGAFAQRFGQDPQALTARRRAIALAFDSNQFQRVADLAGPFLAQPKLEPADRDTVRFQLAASLLMLNQPDESLKQLDALLADHPAEPIASYASFYRGRLLAARALAGSPDSIPPDAADRAIQPLDAAADSTNLPAKQRAEALTLIAALNRKAGREPRAIDAYERLRRTLPLDQVDAATALWVGRALIDESQDENALAWLNAVITAAKNSPPPEPGTLAEALFLAAGAQLKLGQPQQAVEMYRRLLASSRAYGDRARLGLARALAAAGETEEALGEYEGLLNIESSDVAAPALLESARLKLAQARRLESAGDAASAERLRFEASRRLHRVTILYDVPQLRSVVLPALITLARLEQQSGETAKARSLLDSAADRPGDSPWRSIARAERLVLDGRRSDALFLLRQVADAPDPADPQAAADASARLRQLGDRP